MKSIKSLKATPRLKSKGVPSPFDKSNTSKKVFTLESFVSENKIPTTANAFKSGLVLNSYFSWWTKWISASYYFPSISCSDGECIWNYGDS